MEGGKSPTAVSESAPSGITLMLGATIAVAILPCGRVTVSDSQSGAAMLGMSGKIGAA